MTTATLYVVETAFSYGWDAVWMEDDEPQTFDTLADAEAELREHLADLTDAGMEADPTAYRIRDMAPACDCGRCTGNPY
jgi:hypothetical protein